MPHTSTLPLSGSRRPMMHSRVVVLPAPFGPSSPKISPSWISKLTPRAAWIPPYRLRRSRTMTFAGMTENVAGLHSAGHLHQLVVRVDVVDVLRRHQLMFHEDRRRHRTAVQDVEREREDLGAVLFREVRDRPDQPRARLAQLLASLGRGILAHHRAAVAAARLLEGAERTERTGIVDRADEDPLRP